MSAYTQPYEGSTLQAVPSWFKWEPKLYRRGTEGLYLRPTYGKNSPAANFDEIIDILIYWQIHAGWNRLTDNLGVPKITAFGTGADTGYQVIKSALHEDSFGDGGGDLDHVGNATKDLPVYQYCQKKVVDYYSGQFPFLSSLQATGGGIDLMTLPYPGDREITRPDWYPKHLPSLFIRAQNGFLTFKFKLLNYVPTSTDIAAVMLYAQPVIAAGKTPYNVNWYINEDLNGAKAALFWITNGVDFKTWFSPDFQFNQMPFSYIAHANLDDLYTWYGTKLKSTTSIYATLANAIVSKIPVLGQVKSLIFNWADTINDNTSPNGTFSKQVGEDAKAIAQATGITDLSGNNDSDGNTGTAPGKGLANSSNNYIPYIILGLLVVVFLFVYMRNKK